MFDPIAFQFGPLSIRWYSICIMTGVILAVYLARREAPRKKIDVDLILDFILWAFPISLLGARLYYIIFAGDWVRYQNNPLSIIAIWEGGIAIYGALISGALVMLVFSRRHLINLLDFLDIAAPGVMIAQSLGRWGNFFNQEAYGRAIQHLDYLPTFIREQMYIDGSYREPTFLYESLWNLLGFIILMLIRHREGWLKRGEPTAFYLIWYGVGRFFIEGLRSDSLMLGNLKVSQWLSVIVVLSGIGLVAYCRHNKTQPAY